MEPCGIAKLTAFPLQRGLRQSPNFYVAYPWHSSVTSQSQHGTFVSIAHNAGVEGSSPSLSTNQIRVITVGAEIER